MSLGGTQERKIIMQNFIYFNNRSNLPAKRIFEKSEQQMNEYFNNPKKDYKYSFDGNTLVIYDNTRKKENRINFEFVCNLRFNPYEKDNNNGNDGNNKIVAIEYEYDDHYEALLFVFNPYLIEDKKLHFVCRKNLVCYEDL